MAEFYLDKKGRKGVELSREIVNRWGLPLCLASLSGIRSRPVPPGGPGEERAESYTVTEE